MAVVTIDEPQPATVWVGSAARKCPSTRRVPVSRAARSSRGLGCRILSPVTGVRIPYGLPFSSFVFTPNSFAFSAAAR